MKYPKTIKFRVLQRDIDKAVKANKNLTNICRECILAQAASRILKPKAPNAISVGFAQVRIVDDSFSNNTKVSYRLDDRLRKYAALFPQDWEKAEPSKIYVLTKVI